MKSSLLIIAAALFAIPFKISAQPQKLETVKTSAKGSCGFYETFDDYKNNKLTPFDKGECVEYTTSVGGNFIWYKNDKGKKDWLRAWKLPHHWGFTEPNGYVFRIDTVYYPNPEKNKVADENVWNMIVDSGKIMLYAEAQEIKSGEAVTVDLHSVRFSKGIQGKIYLIAKAPGRELYIPASPDDRKWHEGVDAAKAGGNERAAKKMLGELFKEDDAELAAQYEKEHLGSFGNAMEVIMSYVKNYNKRAEARAKKEGKN